MDDANPRKGAERRHPADRESRAPVERVSRVLCAVTGADELYRRSTTCDTVELVLGEYHEAIRADDDVDFDPETGEFYAPRGDLRLEVDRFPLATDRWELLAAVVAVVGLLAAVGARVTGSAASVWVAAGCLAVVVVGELTRFAGRTDVSITDGDD